MAFAIVGQTNTDTSLNCLRRLKENNAIDNVEKIGELRLTLYINHYNRLISKH